MLLGSLIELYTLLKILNGNYVQCNVWLHEFHKENKIPASYYF